ncbi:hypothetical protein EV401DRAFT_1896242 [Pisolithus croceorrhizus]|nr:hypothetical protein EV401DRAFT_1896242 [Pisolithus croceorrhizus]
MPMLTEESLLEVLAAQMPYGEQIHAIHALEAVRYAGIFEDKSPSEHMPLMVTADDMHRAGAHDIQNLLVWKEQMQGNVYEQNMLSTPGDHMHSCGAHVLPTVDVIDEEQIWGGPDTEWPEAPTPLNACSWRRRYRKIQDGKTTHMLTMITCTNDKAMTMQSKVKLQQLWQTYEYLIIGEISMLGKTFLACLSRNIAIGKMVEGTPASSDSFGSINVIMCGDFHQFPPVAVAASEALYIPGNPRKDSMLSQIG